MMRALAPGKREREGGGGGGSRRAGRGSPGGGAGARGAARAMPSLPSGSLARFGVTSRSGLVGDGPRPLRVPVVEDGCARRGGGRDRREVPVPVGREEAARRAGTGQGPVALRVEDAAAEVGGAGAGRPAAL